MPYSRRRELVDQGVSLALEQRVQDLLASVETRAITDGVGVTTGSFFHHFRSRATFAEAVAHRFLERWQERVDQLASASGDAARGHDALTMRTAARSEWDGLGRLGDTASLQHLLWVARDQPIGDDSAETAGQLLREAYRALVDAVRPIYERGLAGMGREMLPPFTSLDLTVLMNAVAEGLQMLASVEPDLVRDELYADGVTALFIGLTRPRTERADTAPPVELAALESGLAAPDAVRPPPREGPVETWRHIADAAAALFVDRSPTEVRVAEVAEVAEVSTSTVYHQFGTVTAVAAAGWVQHVPELRAIAEVPLTAAEGPTLRIEQVLTRYVDLARANRGLAEALVSEAVTQAGPAGTNGRARNIREIVPLPSLVVDLVRELRVRGLLRRRVDSERLARSLFHLVTMQALLFPDESVERVVDETMGMVFDGSLVTPSDA